MWSVLRRKCVNQETVPTSSVQGRCLERKSQRDRHYGRGVLGLKRKKKKRRAAGDLLLMYSVQFGQSHIAVKAQNNRQPIKGTQTLSKKEESPKDFYIEG